MDINNNAGKVVSLPLANRLRIAQLAPLYERIPPKLYGGTERIVSYITEELVRRGHEVTLFAAGDSSTAARLEPGCPESLRLIGKPEQGVFLQLPMISDAYEGAAAGRFDIIHSHIDYWAFPLAELTAVPSIATMHGRLDLPDLWPIYRRYSAVPVVSISDSQRLPLPTLNWQATVYHGLPRDLHTFSPGPGKYLAFLGRISPEKRPDIAIAAARRAGLPLKIAAKVDAVDRVYFKQEIEPLLAPPEIEYIGELNEQEKTAFLGDALALLFTIDWQEPFGLVMIEALACGTPVIARRCGSVPEIIEDGLTGFIANDVNDIVAAIRRISELSRRQCREVFEKRFTAETMADNYERVYRKLIEKQTQIAAAR
ncbi:MAG TPA: glycosyltransferase family 4 protein [Candidatus Binataceae bacterium]|nr:glycosyltransferase family 4 protein [Candidatus Binataceae bacterium]